MAKVLDSRIIGRFVHSLVCSFGTRLSRIYASFVMQFFHHWNTDWLSEIHRNGLLIPLHWYWTKSRVLIASASLLRFFFMSESFLSSFPSKLFTMFYNILPNPGGVITFCLDTCTHLNRFSQTFCSIHNSE